MPKVPSTSTLARQWEMLRIIPRKLPGITAAELTSIITSIGYCVTKRTIERDLRDLSELFPIASSETLPPRGWYWQKDITGEFGGVDVSEVLSITLSEDVLKTFLPSSILDFLAPKFEQARQKLASLKNANAAKLAEKVRYVSDSMIFLPHAISAKIFDNIQNAMINGRQLIVRYETVENETTSYTLNPLGGVQCGVRSYLIATLAGSSEVKKFAIRRFRSVKLAKTPIESPDDFSFEEYVESGAIYSRCCGNIELKAALTEFAATSLMDAPISEDQKIQYIDGSWRLCATVKDSWQLRLWLRAQGASVRVLSPKELCDDVVVNLEAALNAYKTDAVAVGASS